jgi:hypothetical protein
MVSNFTAGFPPGWNIPGVPSIALPEAGFQYRMISPVELQDGILSKGGFRLLYLPYCQAMSKKEVEQVLEFARNGGAVVADLRPAVADEHGKSYSSGALDELFGVTQDTRQAMPAGGTAILDKPIGELSGKLADVRADASLKVNGARALGKLRAARSEREQDPPVLLVNKYGKGTGILLNLDFSDYVIDKGYADRFRSENDARSVHELLKGVFALGGVKVEVPMTPYIPGCHVFRYAAGEAKVLAVLWDAPQFLPGARTLDTFSPSTGKQDRELIARMAAESKTVTLHLPKSYHLYDISSGSYLGESQTTTQKINCANVTLLAAVPYKVESLGVKLEKTSVSQGSPIAFSATVEAKGPVTGMHLLRVQLVNPAGKVVEHYTQKVKAEKGQAQGTIPLALNEAVGQWKIVVKDVLTGVEGKTGFSVSAGAVSLRE